MQVELPVTVSVVVAQPLRQAVGHGAHEVIVGVVGQAALGPGMVVCLNMKSGQISFEHRLRVRITSAECNQVRRKLALA